MVARQTWRFVGLRHLRAEVRHWPRAATQRVKKRWQFAIAMQQVKAERVVARPGWRPVAPPDLQAEVRHWLRAARQRAQGNWRIEEASRFPSLEC